MVARSLFVVSVLAVLCTAAALTPPRFQHTHFVDVGTYKAPTPPGTPGQPKQQQQQQQAGQAGDEMMRPTPPALLNNGSNNTLNATKKPVAVLEVDPDEPSPPPCRPNFKVSTNACTDRENMEPVGVSTWESGYAICKCAEDFKMEGGVCVSNEVTGCTDEFFVSYSSCADVANSVPLAISTMVPAATLHGTQAVCQCAKSYTYWNSSCVPCSTLHASHSTPPRGCAADELDQAPDTACTTDFFVSRDSCKERLNTEIISGSIILRGHSMCRCGPGFYFSDGLCISERSGCPRDFLVSEEQCEDLANTEATLNSTASPGHSTCGCKKGFHYRKGSCVPNVPVTGESIYIYAQPTTAAFDDKAVECGKTGGYLHYTCSEQIGRLQAVKKQMDPTVLKVEPYYDLVNSTRKDFVQLNLSPGCLEKDTQQDGDFFKCNSTGGLPFGTFDKGCRFLGVNAAGVAVIQPTPDKLELLAGAGSMFQIHSFISGKKLALDGMESLAYETSIYEASPVNYLAVH